VPYGIVCGSPSKATPWQSSAFVFGNSSGAVIALDMAKTQPQAVKAVVAHEPPVARVLPDAAKWQRRFAAIYAMAFRFGNVVAMIRFMVAIGFDFHSAEPSRLRKRRARRGKRAAAISCRKRWSCRSSCGKSCCP
jgi:pimeloyl-ACP methyl ester carboxylesterase